MEDLGSGSEWFQPTADGMTGDLHRIGRAGCRLEARQLVSAHSTHLPGNEQAADEHEQAGAEQQSQLEALEPPSEAEPGQHRRPDVISTACVAARR
jgi:hypothetical protein